MNRLRADDGFFAPAVPILALALLLLAGFVVDAARQLNARARAVAYAEEAARAGASAIDLDDTSLTLLPEDDVAARVNAYCAQAKDAGAAITNAGSCFEGIEGDGNGRDIVVVATVEMTQPTAFLGMLGATEFTVSGQAKARPFEGVDAEDAQ